MIKKVQIDGIGFEGGTPEYLIISDRESTNEDYSNLAWKCALKQFPMGPDRKSHYRFIVSDYTVH